MKAPGIFPTAYKSGTFVVFAIDRKYNWSVGFANPDWKLEKGASYDLALSIDGGSRIVTKGKAIGTNHVEVPLADSTQLFNQFRMGNVLQVTAANQTFSFNLDNTSALLPALLECVRHELRPTVANPFAPAQPTQNQTADRQPFQAEAAIVIANVLSAARIDSHRFGTLEEASKFKADAVWTAGKVLGTVKVVPTVQVSNPEIPGALIGDDAKNCKGTFFSGSLPDGDSQSALRVFTACQAADGMFTAYYLAVPRPKGGLYLFTTMSVGAEQPAKKADADLRQAVFQAIR